jgi:hypothetical protein
MEHDSSSPYSQQRPATGPCAETNKTNPQVSITYFKTQFNIILVLLYADLPTGLPNKYIVYFSHLHHATTIQRLFLPFISRNDIRLRTNISKFLFIQNNAFPFR